MIARCTPWGTIWLGDDFYKFNAEQQAAIIAHEEGHIAHYHALIRLWWIVSLRAFRQTEHFLYLCQQHELEADAYAAERGHGPALESVLSTLWTCVKSPELKERLEKLHV